MDLVNWEAAYESLLEKIDSWISTVITNLPNVFLAILLIVVFWLLAKLTRKIVRRVLRRVSENWQVISLLGTISYLATLAIGVFAALGILNLDKTVTSLLAGAGILGLALGFAFQDLAANLMSGIVISLRRPFQLDDLIETNGFFGRVNETNLRSTVLRLLEGQYVILPNKKIFDEPIKNFTQSGQRRVDVKCGVSYGDDLQKAKTIAISAVEQVRSADNTQEVDFFYTEFGNSSVNFVVRFWINFGRQKDFLASRHEAIFNLHKAFEKEGLTIPFPIRTLDFDIVGGKPLSEMLPK